MNNLELIPAVEEIIASIEQLTSKKFNFVEKNDLPVLATVKIARRRMPNHIIYFKATEDKIINHLIAHECGHIKRIYETPEYRRVLYASNERTKSEAYKAISESKSVLVSRFGEELAENILSNLFDGIIRQVTNQPIDLMIEKWIYEDYPGLRQVQLDSLINQNKQALAGLAESTKVFPKVIVDASNTLNAAYAEQLSRIVKYKLNREWKKSQYYGRSKELCLLLDVLKPWSPEDDNSKVIACAENLNIKSWFFTAPFEDIPEDY
ncbi:MAG: hypothetical protein HF312_18820 [Ignavibacteria bacterium]|jgi:hypothetical protein|nr:hypothetical protein [Ignavibacteria bacterium]MCU7522276.1 hypothetical protein [Ignavibacteria bacterium]